VYVGFLQNRVQMQKKKKKAWERKSRGRVGGWGAALDWGSTRSTKGRGGGASGEGKMGKEGPEGGEKNFRFNRGKGMCARKGKLAREP